MIYHHSFQFSSVWSLSHVRLFATPWTEACQASLSITDSRSLLRLMSIESVMPSSHLILRCPQSLPASESFPVSQLFATPWTAASQVSLSITNYWSLLRLMSIESVMPSSHLILCHPLFLLPHSIAASESFSMSQLFA